MTVHGTKQLYAVRPSWSAAKRTIQTRLLTAANDPHQTFDEPQAFLSFDGKNVPFAGNALHQQSQGLTALTACKIAGLDPTLDPARLLSALPLRGSRRDVSAIGGRAAEPTLGGWRVGAGNAAR
jgi:hypothetical protein